MILTIHPLAEAELVDCSIYYEKQADPAPRFAGIVVR